MANHALEEKRIAALRSYSILDTPPEADFDQLTRLASIVGEAPIAVITFIDEKKQWFKSSIGFNFKEGDHSIAFCAYTLRAKELVLLEDASKDERFSHDPLVTGVPHLRFYAGVPLISPCGQALGVLAIMACSPRSLSEVQNEMLHAIARQVMLLLDHRSRDRQAMGWAGEHELAALERLRHDQELLQIASRMAHLGAWEVDLATGRVTWADRFGTTSETGADVSMSVEESLRFHTPESRVRTEQAFYACVRHGTSFDHETERMDPDGNPVWVRVIGEAVRDPDGKIVRVHGAFQNITEKNGPSGRSSGAS